MAERTPERLIRLGVELPGGQERGLNFIVRGAEGELGQEGGDATTVGRLTEIRLVVRVD